MKKIEQAKKTRAPSREGRVAATFYMPEDMKHQVAVLAHHLGHTQEAIYQDALNDFFAKYNMPRVEI